MRKFTAFLVTLLYLISASSALGQDSGGEILYLRYRQLRIPFSAGTGRRRLKQLQLYVSTDQGRTWQPAAVAAPNKNFFQYVSSRDGYFWFAVQTLEWSGRRSPENMTGAEPMLKVIVDTVPPTVTLRPVQGENGQIGVMWDIRDPNLDFSERDVVKLEYRAVGELSWRTLTVNPAAGRQYWNGGANASLQVRMRARDRAGNWGEATVVVPRSNYQGAASVVPPRQSSGPPDPDRRLVNSREVALNYQLEEVGPSGVSKVELWYTQDGRNWNKYPREVLKPDEGKLSFKVEDEGVYGITLLAKSGVGLGTSPPRIGDQPQLWVEVDLTKPTVDIRKVIVGRGPDKGKLWIYWNAQDRNIDAQPITISYSEEPAGPWNKIVRKQSNTGSFAWTMPPEVPYQFYMRIEAADRAGNVGEATTREMIKVDLAEPKVRILDVRPSDGGL